MENNNMKWWTSCLGEIELEMTLEQAESVSHTGQCEMDVKALSNIPEIKKQLESITPETIKKVLSEYGTWDDEKLKDEEENIQRLLWIAGCDIAETE